MSCSYFPIGWQQFPELCVVQAAVAGALLGPNVGTVASPAHPIAQRVVVQFEKWAQVSFVKASDFSRGRAGFSRLEEAPSSFLSQRALARDPNLRH